MIAESFPGQRVFTPEEVACWLRLTSTDYVRARCRNRELAAVKSSGKWRIGRHGLASWLDAAYVH